MHDQILHILHHYGSFALFCLLATGILGLPIPDETLLVIAGFLAAKGELNLFGIIIAGLCGSIVGITVSFLLGRTLGVEIIKHWGKYFGITEKKIKLAHDWFEYYGKWILLIGYFVPGIRHLTGVIAGITKLEYWVFALFAYAGAVIWSLTFIVIGYFFYSEYQHFYL